MTSVHTSDRQENLEQILAEYLETVDAGTPLSSEDVIGKHPEWADELSAFFLAQDEVTQAASDHDDDYDSGIGRVNGSSGGTTAHNGTHPKVGYFGDFRLISEIARGGMGVVYKARQENLQRVVALKMILTGQIASPRDVQRFRQEAEAAACLQHQNIVPIFEVGHHNGQHYFSMGYVDGPSLATIVKEGPLPPREAAAIVEQVAGAIAYAHERGVIHRDLKPANILLDRVPDGSAQNRSHAITLSGSINHAKRAGQYVPKVTDFGLAKIVQGDHGLTGTGDIIGTPSYIPPEQAAGQVDGLEPSVDVYSIGAILYCLLTGRPPFYAATVMETLVQVLDQEPIAPRLLNPLVPRDLETICVKCLQKERRHRYGSAQQLIDELRRFQNGEPIEARPVNSLERSWRWCRRNPVVSSLVSIVALLLLLGTIVSTSFAINADRNATIARQLASDKDTLALIAEQKAAEAASSERLRSKELYVARMNLVQRAWEQERVPRMLELLTSLVPTDADETDLRGFEWRYWWDLLHSDEITIDAGGRVHSIDCSPDGRTLAVGSHEFTLWDIRSGQLLHRLDDRMCRSVAVSPDGRLVAACFERQVIVFAVESGEIVHELNGQAEIVFCVAFHPDGNRLVSGGGDADNPQNTGSGELIVWDLDAGEPLVSIKELPSALVSLAFDPDGSHLAAGNLGGIITQWDTVNWVRTKSWKAGSVNSTISGLSFSVDGRQIVSSGWHSKLWGDQVGTLEGRGGAVSDAEFHPDGRHVFGGLESGTVCLWDLPSKELVRQWQGHTARITSVSTGAQGDRIVSAAKDGGIKVWDPSINQNRRRLKAPKYVSQVRFSPDSQWLACAEGKELEPDRPGVVLLWNLAEGQRRATLRGSQSGVFGVAFDPIDGRSLATAGADGSVLLWDRDSASVIEQFADLESPVRGIDFHPDGVRIATAEESGCVSIWNRQTHDLEREFALTGGRTQHVRFSPSGQYLAALSKRRIAVWDVLTGAEVSHVVMENSHALAIGPDSRIIAATDGRELGLWNLSSGENQFRLTAHNRSCKAVVVAPDGRTVATGGLDGTLKLWSAETGEQLLVFSDVGQLTTVAFSPDGTRLAAAGQASDVVVFTALAP